MTVSIHVFIFIFIHVTMYDHCTFTIDFTLALRIKLEGGRTPKDGKVLIWNAATAEYRYVCHDYRAYK